MCSTYQRPELFLRMAESYSKTVRSPNARLAAYVSYEDVKIEEYKKLTLPNNVSIEYGPKKTMCEVLNYFSCKKYRDYQYYSEVNDDHVFVTEGWDIKMMQTIDTKYNGVSIAHGKTESLPTATMHGAKLVHGLGYFFPPQYLHMMLDLWIIEIDAQTEIMTYVPDVLVDHRHPVFKKAEWDATYQNGEDEMKLATEIHKDWLNNKKSETIKQIKKLIIDNNSILISELPSIIEPLTCFMSTYERIDILKNTINSYLSTAVRPSKIFIFDDGSPNFTEILSIISKIPEAVMIRNEKNQGCAINVISAISQLFSHGAETILILDSDCIFAKKWWIKANEIIKTLDMNKNIACLFNARVHKHIQSPIDGLVHKEMIGGLGMLISKKIYFTYLEKIKTTYQGLTGWDGKLCRLALMDRIAIFACSPSMLQHIGGKLGTHSKIDPVECVADDFAGEPLPGITPIPKHIQERIDFTSYLGFPKSQQVYQEEQTPPINPHLKHPERPPQL